MTGSQYFAENPEVGSRPSTVTLTLPDFTAELTVDRGVFSTQRVDAGSKLLLLEAAQLGADAAGNIVDLGCGYGPIAVTLANRHPNAHIWAVEVNQRARELCEQNLERLGFSDRSTVAAPEDVPESVRFDYIASNPPIRIGKRALHDLLVQWLTRLTPTGSADLVVQKHLGSDSLAAWLTEQGWATTRLCSRAGYRILQVQPRSKAVEE